MAIPFSIIELDASRRQGRERSSERRRCCSSSITHFPAKKYIFPFYVYNMSSQMVRAIGLREIDRPGLCISILKPNPIRRRRRRGTTHAIDGGESLSIFSFIHHPFPLAPLFLLNSQVVVGRITILPQRAHHHAGHQEEEGPLRRGPPVACALFNRPSNDNYGPPP